MDVVFGNISGLQNEGWFDPWLLMAALKMKLASWDTKFITGEVVGFDGDTARFTGEGGEVKHKKNLHLIKVRTTSDLGSVRHLHYTSLAIHGPRLFNSIPATIRNMTDCSVCGHFYAMLR